MPLDAFVSFHYYFLHGYLRVCSLTRTKTALCALRNQLWGLGQLLVCAEGSLLHRVHNVMRLLKGALQSLLERGVLDWVNGSPCEQYSYILPIRRVDNIVFHLRFLRRSEMLLFFISRWFSLLDTLADFLTIAWLHHRSATGLYYCHCPAQH